MHLPRIQYTEKANWLFETDPCPSAATMEPLGTTSTVPSITGSVKVVDVVVVEVVAVDEEKEVDVVEECVDVE